MVRASYIEIYNEEIRDLVRGGLGPKGRVERKRGQVVRDGRERGGSKIE